MELNEILFLNTVKRILCFWNEKITWNDHLDFWECEVNDIKFIKSEINQRKSESWCDANLHRFVLKWECKRCQGTLMPSEKANSQNNIIWSLTKSRFLCPCPRFVSHACISQMWFDKFCPLVDDFWMWENQFEREVEGEVQTLKERTIKSGRGRIFGRSGIVVWRRELEFIGMLMKWTVDVIAINTTNCQSYGFNADRSMRPFTLIMLIDFHSNRGFCRPFSISNFPKRNVIAHQNNVE
jgi:hypothetical protein